MSSEAWKGAQGLLIDKEIRRLSLDHGMITPYTDKMKSPGIISYGQGSTGYDLRMGTKVKIRRRPHQDDVHHTDIIDPKADGSMGWNTEFWCETLDSSSRFILRAGETALAHSVEVLNLPRDVTALFFGKSTYARSGIIANFTPGEPEWKGQLTISLHNASPCDVYMYPMEGICQAVFFRVPVAAEVSYADRGGKYQNSVGYVEGKVLK